jgi:hypothetical protein
VQHRQLPKLATQQCLLAGDRVAAAFDDAGQQQIRQRTDQSDDQPGTHTRTVDLGVQLIGWLIKLCDGDNCSARALTDGRGHLQQSPEVLAFEDVLRIGEIAQIGGDCTSQRSRELRIDGKRWSTRSRLGL